MKSFLLLLLFVANFCFSQTQKADLVFNDGDTLSGYGMVTKNHKIKFRISLDDKPDKWTFLMIKRIVFYGFNMTKTFDYIKINANQKPILAELIREGKVNMYKELEVGGFYSTSIGNDLNNRHIVYKKTKSTTTYIKRANEDIATNLNGNFKKKSLEYFKDCSDITDVFKDKTYLNYRIEDLVIEYNLYCSD